MKLYRATMEVEFIVAAKDDDDAYDVARDFYRDALAEQDYESLFVSEVAPEKLPADWLNSLPYGGDDEHTCEWCAQSRTRTIHRHQNRRYVLGAIDMEARQWTTLDRSQWARGEWDGEPDKMQWTDDATGLPCLIVRHDRMGFLCGYVGVSEGHPAYGKGYSDVDVNVHGGLTFAGKCRPGDTEARGICHVPGPGEPDHVWWLGFDCAHSGDYEPYKAKLAETKAIFARHGFESYRTVGYVRRECADLARQLADLERVL